MAEFQEVMREWARMCMGDHKKKTKEDLYTCDGCPLRGFPCHELRRDWNRVEKIVMAWATEHPEPVYPSWCEWLVDIGVFPKMLNTIPSRALDAISEGVSKPIPADIAQKLGIEPKEG